MRNKGIGRAAGAGVVILAAAVLAGIGFSACESPLLQEIRKASGPGPQPRIRISVGGMEIANGETTDVFVDAVQSVPLDVEFTIHNAGTGDLVLRDTDPIEFSGTDAGLFAVHITPGSLTIAPGASTMFTVRFTLDGPGTRTAQLALYNNTSIQNPYNIMLTSKAFPWIQLLVGSTEIPNGGSYDFGSLAYKDAKEVVFTIRNSGRAELDLVGNPSMVFSEPGYTVVGQQPENVEPLGSETFVIRLQPVSPGEAGGGLSIETNDSERSPYTVSFTGTCELERSSVFIAADDVHTVALKTDGTAWAWGLNNHGQLGNGTSGLIPQPTPVQVQGPGGTGWLTNIASIAAGGIHAAAMKTDVTVWTWGRNNYGRLGDGTEEDSAIPVLARSYFSLW